MNIPDRRDYLRKGREKMGDVKAVTIRWYWILMGESEVNSQICLNNSLIKKNLTIMNEFLFFLLSRIPTHYALPESVISAT